MFRAIKLLVTREQCHDLHGHLVTESRGLAVNLAARPAAITTWFHQWRDSQHNTAHYARRAAGNTTRRTVSEW